MTAPTPLTLRQSSRAGVDIKTGTAGDAVNGNSIPNDGRVVLLVTNPGGSAYTVSAAFPHTVDGNTTAPKVSTPIPAAGVVSLGPYPPDEYGDTLVVTVSNAALLIVPLHVS